MDTKAQARLIDEAVELLVEKVDEYVLPLSMMDDEIYDKFYLEVVSVLRTLCEDYSTEEVEKYL